MDESALKIALKILDTSWSSLEHWLWACAFVVFAGVAIEVVPVIWEYRVERCEFWRGIIHSPNKPSKLKFVLELLGSALIALGIFGELIVGILMAKVETKMRDNTAQLVAIASQKAEDAKDDAARLQLENTELQSLIEPRRLSRSETSAISKSLRKYAGKTVMLQSYNLDVESAVLATQIKVALEGAKINVRDMIAEVTPMGLPLFMGVAVDNSSPEADLPLVKEIVRSLKLDGHLNAAATRLLYGERTMINVPPGKRADAIVLVGVKPISTKE